jgi:hypothetical protein
VRVYRPTLLRPTRNSRWSGQRQLSSTYAAVQADLAQ